MLDLMDRTDDQVLRWLILKRKAAIEAQIFTEYAAHPVEERPDPETWEVIRQATLQRDGYRCRICGEQDTTLQVHHLLELSRGGRTEASNLLTLCKDCHTKIHPWLD
jgi:predicted restriction endonuclease